MTSALRRHSDDAPAVDRALAFATLIELAIALKEEERIEELARSLRQLMPRLTEAERARVTAELRTAQDLETWIG